MRLAGTCSRYSNRAIPQLASAARYHGRSSRFLRWAYHAKVMKTLEAMSSSTVGTTTGMLTPPCTGAATALVPRSCRDTQCEERLPRCRILAVHDAVPTASAGG